MNEKLIPLLSLLLICGLTGCAGVKNSMVKNSMRPSTKDSSWNPIQALTEAKKKDAEEAEPVTVTAIWKDSTYEKPGVHSINGFGGRFFFYDKDSNPVKAKGELVVYGYDDSIDDDTKQGPDKKFVFRESEFQSHFSDSGLGPSYSVWIPWQKVGGIRKMITLIPVFKRSDGTIMKCGQSTAVLRGAPPETQVAQATKDQPYKYLGSSSAIAGKASSQTISKKRTPEYGVQQAGFDGQEATRPRIKTSTINLTPNMAQRMAASTTQKKDIGKLRAALATGAEVVSRQSNPGPRDGAEFGADNSFPLNTMADQPESSALSSSTSPRKVFGAPGSLN